MKQKGTWEKQDSESFGGSVREHIMEENTPVDGNPTEAVSETTTTPRGEWPLLALKALRQLELIGMKVDYAKIKKQHTDDLWWVRKDEIEQGPAEFSEVLRALLDGAGPIYVMHDSDRDAGADTWFEMNHSPLWLQKWPARLWTIAFWLIAGIFGLCVVQAITPGVIQRYAEIAYVVGFVGWWGYYLFNKSRAKAPKTAEFISGDEPDAAS